MKEFLGFREEEEMAKKKEENEGLYIEFEVGLSSFSSLN